MSKYLPWVEHISKIVGEETGTPAGDHAHSMIRMAEWLEESASSPKKLPIPSDYGKRWLSSRDLEPHELDQSGWKTTSIRWLKDHHPKYVSRMPRAASTPAHEALSYALASMSYMDAESTSPGGALCRGTAQKKRAELLKSWDRARHSDMCKFLEEDGYAPLLLRLQQQHEASRVPKEEKAAPQVQTLEEVVQELSNPAAGSW